MDLKKLQNGSDVRGIALGEDRNLTEEAVQKIADAFCYWLTQKTGRKDLTLAVGMDSRISGPALKKVCIDAFAQSGAQVLDCGMASTPAMFMTTVTDGFMSDGAVMITASHLPSNRNGMKFFTKDGGLEKTDIAEVLALAEQDRAVRGTGSVKQVDFMSVYSDILVKRLLHEVKSEKPAFENIINPLHLLRNYFIIPKKDNPRIIRQSGAFIMVGLQNTIDPERVKIRKIIIPCAYKHKILKELESLGISKITLHPELYKMAEYITESFLDNIEI